MNETNQELSEGHTVNDKYKVTFFLTKGNS